MLNHESNTQKFYSKFMNNQIKVKKSIPSPLKLAIALAFYQI